MANPPSPSVYGIGTQVASGYAVFSSKDSAGTMVTPVGNYVWNGTLWVTWPVDENGVPQTSLAGSITNLDNTKTALTAGQTYNTPTPFDLTKYKTIVGSVFADQGGTLIVEQSWDGTNWDVQSTISVTGGNGQGFSIDIVALKGRLSYTNGATDQGAFRLYAGGKTL